jgi:alkylation response protein AidB-like acyl-CoA dehydrogenase
VSDEHRLILDSVERLVRNITPDEVVRRDEAHTPPYDYMKPLAELGLTRAWVPEAQGGFGLPWRLFGDVQFRIASRAQPVAAMLNRIIAFGIMPILNFGTGEQQARLLPGLFDGERLMVLALTEPGAGSDGRAITTRATKVEGGWRVNGRKTWISDAGVADWLLTPCRIAGEEKKRFVTLMVARDASGIAMTPIPKVGNNYMPSFDIGYDDVFVPDGMVLGEVGRGFETITGTLKYSRAGLSTMLMGSGRAVVDLARNHALERVQFGRPIAEFQAVRHKIVDMEVSLHRARLVVADYLRALDAGEDVEMLGAITKLTATEMFHFVTDHGMQVLASAGYASDSAMQMHWRNARLYTFGEGANEIQKEIIGRAMGLAGRRGA